MIKKRELEKQDNWRERGLMDMMGGVLQIRREDELKKVNFKENKINNKFLKFLLIIKGYTSTTIHGKT